jgi:uncharacterized protein (DUF983 family)
MHALKWLQQKLRDANDGQGSPLNGHSKSMPKLWTSKLFCGFLKLASRCDVCGLDYGFADPGGGPAFFAMTVMSFPVVGFEPQFQLVLEEIRAWSERHTMTSD